MGNPRTGNRAKKNCPHLETTVTHHAGIQRVTCRGCGHVTLQHFEDSVGEHAVMTWSRLISRAGLPKVESTPC
jgi:hypothetical protein